MLILYYDSLYFLKMQKVNNHQLYIFLISVLLIKVIFSFFIELGNDEAYYYTYALKPQLNYFDHPPMVGILIRLSTLNLVFINDILLRLGPSLSCFIASLFLFKTVDILYNRNAAWYTVVMYNLAVYTTIIAGWFILPDSPQLPFWCAALYVMVKIIFQQNDKEIKLWVVLGTLIGLAVLCKIHALYLWVGFGLFILFYRIKWLANWRLYLSIFITLLFLLPILFWNIENNFITYRFHSERVSHTTIKMDSFLREVIGEALYQNPILFVLIIVSLVYFIKQKSTHQQTKNKKHFLLLMSLPMIFLFWAFSFFNDIFPHWSGPAYIPLFIIAGYYLSEKFISPFPIWLKLSAGLMLIAMFSITYLANFSSINLGSKEKKSFGEYSPTLDISGWKDFSNDFDKLAKQDLAQNKMQTNSKIVVNKWFPACQLDLYTSRKTGISIVAIGSLAEVHHYAWLNTIRPKLQLGNDAYCIVPSNVPTNVVEHYSNYFSSIQQPDTIKQLRNNIPVRYFYIWRLKHCKLVPQDILEQNFNKIMAR